MSLVSRRRSGAYELELHQIDDLGEETALGTVKALGADRYTIRFLKELGVFDQSDYVVVAKVEHRVVGVFGLMRCGGWETRGTYTIASYRRKGVAKAMWNFAVRSLCVRALDCIVITRSGRGFAEAWKKTRTARLHIIDDVTPWRMPA